MFDQAGMVRELVKWDYELRVPAQVGDVVSRAVEVAMASPRGPVYLVLPREPLSAPVPEPIGPLKPRPQAAAPHADPRSVAQLADWIAAAERPLIIVSTLPANVPAVLGQLAERAAIPVVVSNPRTVCLPSTHPMHFGFEPGALLADADLVIVIDADVPWIPSLQNPPAGCHVAHIGEEPFFVRYPMRSFPSDLAIQAGTVNTLTALIAAMGSRLQMAEARIAARRARLTERMRTRRAQLAKDSASGQTISPEYLSRCIGEAVGPDAVIFNEYSLRAAQIQRDKPDTLFALGPAGGLGWGFGAALGAKLAAPEKFIVATLGDGAYMFANPTVGHWVSACTICRSSPSCSITAVTAPCGTPRCRCSRMAPRARTMAACSPISIRRRRSRRWRARKAPMRSAWKNPPTCRMRWRAPAPLSSTNASRRCSM